MAILWYDGFELDRTRDALEQSYSLVLNFPTSRPATTGRFFGSSLRNIPSSGPSELGTFTLPWTYPSFLRRSYMGIAIRTNSPGSQEILRMVGSTGVSANWSVQTVESGSGEFAIRLLDIDSATVFTSTNYLYDTWIYLELFVYCQNNGSWIMRINGSEVGSGTADFYQAPPEKFVIRWGVLPTSAEYIEYDDMYLSEDTGFFGDLFAVEASLPVADSPYIAWEDPGVGVVHYSLVNESGESDGDSTYVETNPLGIGDAYYFSPPTNIQAGIISVRVNIDARNPGIDDGQAVAAFIQSVSSPTPIYGAETTLLGSYSRGRSEWVLNPMTNAAWTILLYDENGVLGQLATHNLNTNLKILDESQLEGDFPLTVI